MKKKETASAARESSTQAALRRTLRDLSIEERLYVDSVWVLSVLFLVACLWSIFVVIWHTTSLEKKLTPDNLTIIMEVLAIAALFHLLKKTSLTVKDMGLKAEYFKQSVKRTLYRIPIMLAVFCLSKFILLAIKPDIGMRGKTWASTPFWDWSEADIRLIRYLFTSLLQEFLARGGVQEALTRVLPGKHRDVTAIFLTSVFFMALHVQKGMLFMFGAGILSFLLGFVYRRDRSVFGVWMIHYFFGKFADFLTFV